MSLSAYNATLVTLLFGLLILLVMAEAVLLSALLYKSLAGADLASLLANLGAGAFLMAATLAVAAQTPLLWVLAALSAALVMHLLDLALRLRLIGGPPSPKPPLQRGLTRS
jgi:hypothetical protein